MDNLISTLSTFPPDKSLSGTDYDKAATAYVKELLGISQSSWTQGMSKTNIFEALDPAVNSIGYLIALQQYTAAAGTENGEQALRYATSFFANFDPAQVRYVMARWRDLYHWTADALLADQRKDTAFMGDALLRFDEAAAFTVCHLTFLRLCLRLSTPSIAIPVLDRDIHVYSSTSSRPSPTDNASTNDDNGRAATITHLSAETVLEYHLLGAQVYIGASNWSRARLFLELIILHPSSHHATSIFQIEAYKKWILLGLLTQGSPFISLRTIDQVVLKSLRAIAKPYDVLTETFKSRNWRRLQAEVDVGAQLWIDDGNARLVQAVADANLTYCVSDLRRTYTAVPVSTVAEHLGLPVDQTHDLLRRMIDQGRLKAGLTSSPASSTSLQFEHGDDATRQPHQIEAQTKRIEALVRAIRDADRRSRLTKEYLDVMKRNKRQNADDDPADQMDLEWTSTHVATRILADDGDEDIMA